MLPIFDWYSVMDIVHATYSYTFTGTKLARPWSIGSSHIHVCNNHCRARFLRAINSSSPHSWVPLSLSLHPNATLSLCKGIDRLHVGNVAVHDLRRGRAKSSSPLACSCQKGHDSMFSIHLTICLVSIFFFLYISIFCCSFNLHKTLQSGMHMIINSLLGQVRNLNFTERSVMFKFPQKNYD